MSLLHAHHHRAACQGVTALGAAATATTSGRGAALQLPAVPVPSARFGKHALRPRARGAPGASAQQPGSVWEVDDDDERARVDDGDRALPWTLGTYYTKKQTRVTMPGGELVQDIAEPAAWTQEARIALAVQVGCVGCVGSTPDRIGFRQEDRIGRMTTMHIVCLLLCVGPDPEGHAAVRCKLARLGMRTNACDMHVAGIVYACMCGTVWQAAAQRIDGVAARASGGGGACAVCLATYAHAMRQRVPTDRRSHSLYMPFHANDVPWPAA